jgi:predicted Fe-S protein YdhL (DUF1289 family)
MSSSAPSPCVGICKLNEATTHCLGCKRTLEEIASWRDYSSQQRQHILQQLSSRQIQ